MSLLAITVEDGWRPGIGDPTLMGWVTVAAYFGVALLCGCVALAIKRSVADYSRGRLLFWRLLALFLVVLGINKQLDLQTFLTVTGKRMALAQGWYEHRRVVQVLFIGMLVAGGGLLGLICAFLTRRAWSQNWLALAGALFLGCFVLVRALSFHHVDQLLGFTLGGMKVNWILELGGIGLIGMGAWKRWRAERMVGKTHER